MSEIASTNAQATGANLATSEKGIVSKSWGCLVSKNIIVVLFTEFSRLDVSKIQYSKMHC